MPVRELPLAAPTTTSCCGIGVDGGLGREEAERSATLLKAVADPVRLRLLSAIRATPDGEACVCDLTDLVGLAQPTVSHHLKVLTSAGLSAGIDLSLHVVRRDHGAACADRVARQMVAAPHRDGGQAQFFRASEGDSRASADGSLEETRAWARERLAEPLTVEAMARHANVSPRTFARRFRAETGTTPLQWLLSRRVLEARRLLEESDLPVETVALRAGFGNAASLRDHFRRATATTPTAYRRTFQPAG